MSVTLRDMIDETATYVKADLEDDDGAEIEGKIKSAINEAKNIVSQRFAMVTCEDVTLDGNSCFDVADLSKSFWGLKSIDGGATTSQIQNGLIWCAASPESSVSVEYNYIPTDMENDADVFPFPDAVPWRVLCYYAAARYYEIKGTATSLNKYRYWMNEFDSGVSALRGGRKSAARRIKAVYNL